jgi:hypothetical protein
MRLEVRRATLDDDLRDLFEQYGEQVVAMALALGSNQGTGLRTHPVAPTHAMNVVHAAQWLQERRDLAERRETIADVRVEAHLGRDLRRLRKGGVTDRNRCPLWPA